MWAENPGETNPKFKQTLVLISLIHLLVIGVLILLGSARAKPKTESLVWLNPGSFGGALAAGNQSAAAENTPEMAGSAPPENSDDADTNKEEETPVSSPLPTPVVEPELTPLPPVAPPTPISTPTELAPPAATPKPTAQPASEPSITPKPEPSPLPKATPKPTPKPSPKPTPKATPKSTPKPTPKEDVKPKPPPSPKASPKSEETTALAKVKPSPPKPPKKEKKVAEESASPTPAQRAANASVKNSSAKSGTTASAGTKQPGTGNGTGSGESAGSGDSKLALYAEVIKNRFQAAWNQPHGAMTAGSQLVATVKLRIEADGTVTDFTLVDGSGNTVVDESVREAGHRITRLPPPPSGATFSPIVRFELGE
jgi:TonB family protein